MLVESEESMHMDENLLVDSRVAQALDAGLMCLTLFLYGIICSLLLHTNLVLVALQLTYGFVYLQLSLGVLYTYPKYVTLPSTQRTCGSLN